jgi:hypothetical protein
LPSVTGSSYQSPTYGYAVTWDADWTVVRSTSDEGQDQLVLSQGPIRATFHGVPAGDGTTLPTDPDDCLEAIVERVATDPAIANFGPAPAELGGPIGDDVGAAAGSYVSEVTSQSGNTGEVVYFISCRKLSPTAALITTYTALRSQAEVAVPLFRALDANFVLSGDATPAP